MWNIIINPTGMKQVFIDNTRECFGPSFDLAKYNWYFERTVGKNQTDFIFLFDDDELMAGSAVTYRQLLLENKEIVDIAVMTYSWTLPNARGKGCFSKIIELSKEIAYKKNVHCLTGWGVEENASFRRLRNAGSHLVPTYYMFSPEELPFEINNNNISIITNSINISELYSKRSELINNDISVGYDNIDDFEGQFVKRYLKTEILKVNNDIAVIEETYDLIKLVLLNTENKYSYFECVKSLAQWSLKERKKKFLFYTVDTELCNMCKNLNFTALSGAFYMIFSDKMQLSDIIGDKEFSLAKFNFQYGDKM